MGSNMGSGSGSVSPGLERKREQRRIAIIRAALDALGEKGLAETRMTDIARRVGMSPGHVLYYFPSKKALLMAALQWHEELFYRQAAEELEKLPSAWDRLVLLMERNAPSGQGDPGWLLWLETWANAAHDEEVARHQAEFGRRWTAQLVRVVREGQDRGEFASVPADLFAFRLTALMDGLAIMVVTDAGRVSRQRMVQESRRWAAEQLGVREGAAFPRNDVLDVPPGAGIA